jgi:RNA polymerase sigma-70 factor (ECF subfamily)
MATRSTPQQAAAGGPAGPGAAPAPRTADLRAAPAPPAPDPEGVFRRHAPMIYRVARRMLPSEVDAEDVVQEVLLQVVRKLGTFAGRAELTTWLQRVTVNCALAYRAKSAARAAREVHAPPELLEEGARPPAGTPQRGVRPEEEALDGELRRQIAGAIARLPETYRDAWVLWGVQGLSKAEVARALGLSVPAVRSRLHRGRLLLRHALAPYVEEGQAAGRPGRPALRGRAARAGAPRGRPLPARPAWGGRAGPGSGRAGGPSASAVCLPVSCSTSHPQAGTRAAQQGVVRDASTANVPASAVGSR